MPSYHRFIPVRKAELIQGLKRDFGFDGKRGERFDMLASLLHQLYRYSFDAVFEEIKECYYPFNPDRDTVTLDRFDEPELLRRRRQLEELFSQLMNVANCERMTDATFQKYVNERSVFGLDVRVDTDEYEALMVFYRGELQRTFERRALRKFFRKEEFSVDCFQRLIVLIKAVGDEHVYIKLFKDVPANALETLLPRLDIRMKLIDKMKLGGSGLAGVLLASVRFAVKAFQFAGRRGLRDRRRPGQACGPRPADRAGRGNERCEPGGGGEDPRRQVE